jgi:hypothetical protein
MTFALGLSIVALVFSVATLAVTIYMDLRR